MFTAIYWSTIKGFIRSRVGRVAFIFIFLICFFLHMMSHIKDPATGIYIINYIRTIVDCINWVLIVVLLFLIPAIVASVMYDKDQDVYDIEIATKMKQRTFLSGKLLAILTLYHICAIFMLAINFMSRYIIDADGMKTKIPLLETVLRFAVGYLYAILPVSTLLIGTITLITLLFQRKSCGIITGAVYIIGAIFIQNGYFSLPPNYIGDFFRNQKEGELSRLLTPGSQTLIQAMILFGIGLAALLFIFLVLPRIKKNIYD